MPLRKPFCIQIKLDGIGMHVCSSSAKATKGVEVIPDICIGRVRFCSELFEDFWSCGSDDGAEQYWDSTACVLVSAPCARLAQPAHLKT